MLLSRRIMLAGSASAAMASPARAVDKIAIGALRFVSSGGLFLAVERGYFQSEGLDVDLKFFEAAQPIAVAVVSGDIQFGLTAITAGALNLAGKGGLAIVASQGAERRGYIGNRLLISNAAFARGLDGLGKLAGATAAITQVGSSFHYQFGQIAEAAHFPLERIALRPLQSVPNMAAALRGGQVDAAILPPHIAAPLIAEGQAKLLADLSMVGEYQYGAMFTAPGLIRDKRGLVQSVVRAYRKGLADYAKALIRPGGERPSDTLALRAGAEIGKYVYPTDTVEEAGRKVIASAVYCDPQGRIDMADIEHQVFWYKQQKLVDETVEARRFVDQSFTR